MVVDIPINCCVRLLHLVPILLYLTLWDGKHEVQSYKIISLLCYLFGFVYVYSKILFSLLLIYVCVCVCVFVHRHLHVST